MEIKILITFFCLVGAMLVMGEPEPEPEDESEGEFVDTKKGVAGKAYKKDDTTIHIKDFSYRGTAHTASFYVGQTSGLWNETLAPFKKESDPGTVYQGIDSDTVFGANYIITLPADQIKRMTYLSVFSKQDGVLGHVTFNGAGNLFQSVPVMVALVSSLFVSYLLY